jgi:Xaa-Pro aminopeptidase
VLDTSRARRGKYTNIARVYDQIKRGPYDALILMSPESIPYFSGFFNFDIRGLVERFHFVIWPKDGDPALVVIDRRKVMLTPDETFIQEIRDYQGEGLDCIRAVGDTLRAKKITSGRIGIEARHFPTSHAQALQAGLPDLRFDDALPFVEFLRAVRTPAEIELLTRFGQITVESIDEAFRNARPGDTERKIAAHMCHEVLRRGADGLGFCYLGSAERSGRFHGVATDAVVPTGRMLKVDFGAILDGYYSDHAREVVIGKATQYQREMHGKVSEANRRVVAGIRPGMTAAEVFVVGQRAYRDLGAEYKWAILGHGIGTGTHETPQLYPWVEEPILEGMTMMIETGYGDYPRDSFHVEDLILVTDRGAKYLTNSDNHQQLWEVGENVGV